MKYMLKAQKKAQAYKNQVDSKRTVLLPTMLTYVIISDPITGTIYKSKYMHGILSSYHASIESFF